jgi:branched-chain amino acid transport system ATP-binding protein
LTALCETENLGGEGPGIAPGPSPSVLLEVDHLSTRYGPIEAVRDVSLHVNEGEIVAILGSNGAGKSTILASIMGLVKTSAGKVRFLGRDVTGKDPESMVRLGVGLVPEGRRLFKELTVSENLRLGAATRKDKEAARKDLERLFTLFPILKERRGQLAGLLSGGEAQQLAIARTLMTSPRLLCLDEPSLGLAPRLVDAVFDLLRDLRGHGYTMLLVEQNALQALEFVDRAYVLRNGQIQMEASAASMQDEKELLKAYLGVKG